MGTPAIFAQKRFRPVHRSRTFTRDCKAERESYDQDNCRLQKELPPTDGAFAIAPRGSVTTAVRDAGVVQAVVRGTSERSSMGRG